MADNITPQRSYASGVRLTVFGMVSFPVDAVPQARPNHSKDGAMRRVLLVDGAPVPVEQRYVSPDGAVHEEHELGRARETGDGTLVPLDPETVVAAKVGDLAKNELSVSVHPADQVERFCRPGGGGYRLRPPRTASAKERELYATVRATVAAAPQVAFVGALRLRDTRSLYRLVVWQDQLLLAELVQPADLAQVDVVDVEPDAELVEMANKIVANSISDFAPEAYYHDVAAAFDAALTTAPVVPTAPTLTAVPDRAADIFTQALAAVAPKPKRARKPAAKKPAVKKPAARRTARKDVA